MGTSVFCFGSTIAPAPPLPRKRTRSKQASSESSQDDSWTLAVPTTIQSVRLAPQASTLLVSPKILPSSTPEPNAEGQARKRSRLRRRNACESSEVDDCSWLRQPEMPESQHFLDTSLTWSSVSVDPQIAVHSKQEQKTFDNKDTTSQADECLEWLQAIQI